MEASPHTGFSDFFPLVQTDEDRRPHGPRMSNMRRAHATPFVFISSRLVYHHFNECFFSFIYFFFFFVPFPLSSFSFYHGYTVVVQLRSGLQVCVIKIIHPTFFAPVVTSTRSCSILKSLSIVLSVLGEYFSLQLWPPGRYPPPHPLELRWLLASRSSPWPNLSTRCQKSCQLPPGRCSLI